MRATRLLLLLLLLTTTALLAGCGDSDDDSSDDSRRTDTATETTDDAPSRITEHMDGTIKVQGDTLVLRPTGRAPVTFVLGDDVELAQVKALETSGSAARVTYEPALDEDDPIAISVQAIQEHGDQQSYTGTIVKVDDETIVIKGADGEKTYAMGIADEHEIEHLGEHRDQASPVTVFLSAAGSDAGETVVAYEDA